MAIKNSWASGEVLTAADLTDTMKGVYINAQTGTTYTFALTDGFVTLSNSSGGTATIPANSTAAFNTGAVIGVMNAGTAGSFVIAAGSGVTLNAVSGTTTLAPLEAATLVKLATNTWQLSKGGGGGIPKADFSDAATGTYTGYKYKTFTASGTLTVTKAGLADIVVCGGGGGGSTWEGGGGGAGGVLIGNSVYLPAGTLTVTIGAGGAAATSAGSYDVGQSGNPSLINVFVAPGGGNGGGGLYSIWGDNGGSGGGGGYANAAGGSGIASLGNNGGNGSTGSTRASGGGGGAGGVGGTGVSTTGGAGGAGTTTSIAGTTPSGAYVAGNYALGGGGGGSGVTGGAGGSGGGGAGGTTTAGNGTANTGGGGGGTGVANSSRHTAGNGGSGIVIVRVEV